MALPLSWNGNGLAAGAVTTTSAGTGDTPFSEIGAGSPQIVSSGTTAPRIQFPAATGNTYVAWEQAAIGTVSSYVVTVYFELASLGSASHALVKGASAANAESWRVDVAGTGSSPASVLRLRNGTAQVAAGTTALTANTLYRLEVTANGSATTATLYVGNSTTAHTTLNGTATLTSISEVWFGNPVNVTANPQILMDGFAMAVPGAATADGGTVTGSGVTTATATATPVANLTAAATGNSNVTGDPEPVLAGTATASATSTANATLLSAAFGSVAASAASAATAYAGSISVVQAQAAASAQSDTLVVNPTGGEEPPPPPPPDSGSAPIAGMGLPMRRNGYFVVIRDANLNTIGALNPTNVRINMRYNDVSDWSLTVPLERTSADLLRVPGAGVLIYRGDTITGEPIITGPIGSRSMQLTEDGIHISVEGPDDLIWVRGRVAFQMPNRAVDQQGATISGQTTNTHDRRSGPAESVIKGYVNANAGPSALTSRRRVVIEADGLRGNQVAGSARMTPLLDLIRPLAETGGVGFKVVQTANKTLEFRVYVPADRTRTARFGVGLGNVTEWSLFERAPSATTGIVGGQGQMAARIFKAQTDPTAQTTWPGWNMEQFMARTDTALTSELDQSLAEILLEGGPHTSMTFTTKDTERLQFGRDYRMGDRVSVEPMIGKVITDIVREVNIDWTVEDNESVVTQVGTVETSGTPAIQKLARKLKVRSESVETVE